MHPCRTVLRSRAQLDSLAEPERTKGLTVKGFRASVASDTQQLLPLVDEGPAPEARRPVALPSASSGAASPGATGTKQHPPCSLACYGPSCDTLCPNH